MCLRLSVPAGLAALMLAAPISVAEPLSVSRELRPGSDPALVSRIKADAGAFYVGVESSVLPDAGYHTRYVFALGIRPTLGQTRIDLRYDYGVPGFYDRGGMTGRVTLDIEHPFSERVRVETMFQLDQTTSIVAVQHDLRLQLGKDFSLNPRLHEEFGLNGADSGDPVYEIGAVQNLGKDAALRVGLAAGSTNRRLGITYQIRF